MVYESNKEKWKISIFKSCDIRGVYHNDLTPAFALDLGRAIGTELVGGGVVVGGDVRPSTPHLKGALIEGLMMAGCTVIDVGLVPTSALYFAQNWLQTDGAVMVTASHNPPGYNGFKLQLGPGPDHGAGPAGAPAAGRNARFSGRFRAVASGAYFRDLPSRACSLF